jgi:DNA-binding CsgD family transcriptional regulator
VLELLARGFRTGEIAAALGVTPHTVTTHVRHLYRKLEVGSRGEAVFEAVSRGLLRPES